VTGVQTCALPIFLLSYALYILLAPNRRRRMIV